MFVLADQADPLFSSWLDALRELPDVGAIRAIAEGRRRLEALEAEILAQQVSATGDDRKARTVLEAAGGGSARDRRRRVARARLVNSSEEIGELWSSGKLCGEQIDALVEADRASDGQASADSELVEEIVAAGPEGAGRAKKDWLTNRTTDRDLDRRYRRQRAARTAWRHRTDTGLAAVTLAGDDASIETWWRRNVARADAEYRKDGGRQVPASGHRRTRPQRLFDAAVEVPSSADGASPSSRPAAVVTFAVDPSGARDGAGELVGYGPITDEAAAQILCDAELWTMLADPVGRPLWLGRSTRHPTRAQLLALIVRDGGCVETGEHWQDCHAHHSPPWSSRARGQTDIDQLVLLDRDAHRRTHSQQFTWEFDDSIGKWRKRPATPDEVAAARPTDHPQLE